MVNPLLKTTFEALKFRELSAYGYSILLLILFYLVFLMFHRNYWISGDEKLKAVASSNTFIRALNKYVIHCIGIFLYIFFVNSCF